MGQAVLLFTPNLNVVEATPVHNDGQPVYTIFNTDTAIAQTSVDSSYAFATSNELVREEAAAPKISLNKNASKFVKDYLRKEDEALLKAKERSRSYFKMMDEVFSRYDLPVELKYLAVVESDLKTSALSRVGAKGLWQLMPQTARELGLTVKGKFDERTYAYKSTVAAAKYLKALYAEFGDWLLVLAAYNGGPGTVYNAIHRSGSRNFWALQSFLPAESRGHVKRFIGTHYFFEGEGGLTTMTKSETLAYQKAIEILNASRQSEKEERNIPVVVAVNAVTAASQEQ